MQQKQTQLTSFRPQLAQTRLCGTRKTESATLRGILAILCAAVPEEDASNESQGGAANSIRPRTANLGIKVGSSPAVQHGETVAHRGSGYSTRRLESTKKGATAVILDTKLEMSQRCELAMKMPTRHDSLDVKIEVSPQRVSTKRASRSRDESAE